MPVVLERDSESKAVPIEHSKSTVVLTGHWRWKTELTVHTTRMTVPRTVQRKRKRKRPINRLPTRRGGRSMIPSSAGAMAHANPNPKVTEHLEPTVPRTIRRFADATTNNDSTLEKNEQEKNRKNG